MRTRAAHVMTPSNVTARTPGEPPVPASRHAFRGGSFIPNNPHKMQAQINAPVTIQLPYPSSEEQGIGKSPGMRWPWYRFFTSLSSVRLPALHLAVAVLAPGRTV